MSEIQSNLNSSAWWFSAVVVALIINIASAYAKPWIDTLSIRLGHRWRTRTEAKRSALAAEVAKNAESPHLIANLAYRENRSRQRAIFFFLIGLFLGGLGQLSGYEPGKATTFASATTLEVIHFIAKMIGFLTIGMSLALMSSADRLEEIVTTASRMLADKGVAAEDKTAVNAHAGDA